jgi:DNA mismatch repair protein MutL
MSKIKILPEILSNKIAAGEVVERPASVVKELLENALDAESDRIIIEIEKGGRSLIRVSDNGTGMNRDDALLSLERYATSKIFSDQDLFSINTLGFRGEALPSIASVSRFTLVTRDKVSNTGTEIIVDGGKIKQVSETGAPVGTMISVQQLFFNTPARRKFLKSIGTEMSHITEAVASTAMGWPGVRFKIIHNNRTLKNWPATNDPYERIIDVVGRDLKQDLHPIAFQADGVAVSGWISSPRVTRTTSRGLYIFVNGRYVRDRIMQHALFQGYSQRLIKGQFPVAVITIKVPFDQVDVNVHPTKSEVRFANQRQVHDAVKRAAAQTLYEIDHPGWRPPEFSRTMENAAIPRIAESLSKDFGFNKQGFLDQNDVPVNEIRLETEGKKTAQQTEAQNFQPATRSSQEPIWQKRHFADLRVIGQYHNTYLVCESEKGLIIIDQHAAHERIIYEQLCAQAATTKTAAQQLLVPETIELGFKESQVLEKLLPGMNSLGLGIEHFGGNTFIVKSVPALLADRELKPVVIEMAEEMVELGSSPGLEKALDHCRMIMACHGAIRAGQPLSDEQVQNLLDQLDACDNPSHCPHGRPTWIRWDLKMLEKSFKRIV